MEMINNIELPLDYGYVSMKQKRLNEIKDSSTYRNCEFISKVLDKYYIDPIIGLIFPFSVDFLSQIFVLPFIRISLFRIHSIPLTLAIIYNASIDLIIGSIPILGDIFDFFFKSHVRNLNLISGYIDNDQKIKKEVRQKARKCVFFIILMLSIIFTLIALICEWL